MIKAIFWDNDGVLADTEHLYYQATQQVLATVGVTLTKEDYIEFLLVQGKGAWHLAAEKGVRPEDIEELRHKRNTLYASLLQQEQILIDGVGEVLEALSGKYVMGVVTSSRKDHFDIIHRQSGLLKYFQFVLTGDDYSQSKPHPAPYLRALEVSGLCAEDCLVIEDSERGLESALRAGIRCIVVPNGFTCGRNFIGAHKVKRSLNELLSELL